jgi:hypothetical protein
MRLKKSNIFSHNTTEVDLSPKLKSKKSTKSGLTTLRQANEQETKFAILAKNISGEIDFETLLDQ